MLANNHREFRKKTKVGESEVITDSTTSNYQCPYSIYGGTESRAPLRKFNKLEDYML